MNIKEARGIVKKPNENNVVNGVYNHAKGYIECYEKVEGIVEFIKFLSTVDRITMLSLNIQAKRILARWKMES